jgi:hypothetical protein
MKTKTLFLTAALGVAGAATTMAQVYSVNAVGYVNSVLTAAKFNMISNPLDAGAGNNTVEKLFANAPAGLLIYKFTNGGYENPNAFDPDLGGWDNPTQTLMPGEGAFVLMPAGDDVTVTFVGEVVQGVGANAPTIDLPQGFAMVSSKVPQTGLVSTDLGYPVGAGDIVYTWSPAAGYTIYAFDPDLGGWDPEEPTIGVGEAFWSLKTEAASWVREFSVNQ